MGFTPRLEVLQASQRLPWDEIREVPREFTLYGGGTAVALRLGHRESVDFDFFGAKEINPRDLYTDLPFLKGSSIIQQERNTLTCLVDRTGPVKVSFFGLPHLRTIESPSVAVDNHLRIDSLLDLAGTKAAVVQQRAEAKDYVDIDAIMRAGIGLPKALSAARYIFGDGFNAQITLKAFSYFGEGDLLTLLDDLKRRLVHAVAATDLNRLPPLVTEGEMNS